MRQFVTRNTVLLVATLFLVLSVPEKQADRFRSGLIGLVRPLSAGFSLLKRGVVAKESSESLHISQLRLELARTRAQRDFLSNVDRYEEQLLDQFTDQGDLCEASQWRVEALRQLLRFSLQAIPARVVYRSRSGGSSALWLDVGDQTNRRLDESVIAKNSPVVLGDSLVGVIDYVGTSRCRVRLLTDPLLHPAVRAARGGRQDRELYQHILAVQEILVSREDLFSQEATEILTDNLEILKDRLEENGHTWYLAKGELSGSARSLWRQPGTLLRGIGFQYDFADAEGPARDLRTGADYGHSSLPPIAILLPGDLLVTTGMDGVFPSGLKVARVVDVDPLEDGAYTYSLTARPTAGDFNDFTTLFVLPPL